MPAGRLSSSDDGHRWLGVRKAVSDTQIRKLVDKCGSERQKICHSCRINFADLLLLCARFQVDFMGGDLNAFSYQYFRTVSQQTAASLQDSSLAVMLRRFDEAVNAQLKDTYANRPEYQFRSDLYMAHHDKDIEEYRLKRGDILMR